MMRPAFCKEIKNRFLIVFGGVFAFLFMSFSTSYGMYYFTRSNFDGKFDAIISLLKQNIDNNDERIAQLVRDNLNQNHCTGHEDNRKNIRILKRTNVGLRAEHEKYY